MPEPTPKTPTEAADEIRVPILEGAPETVTPAALKKLIVELRAMTQEIAAQETNLHIQGEIEGAAHVHFLDQIQRWTDLLDYYEEQVDAADPNDWEATAKTVYAPLIVGLCYGPPSCSQANADAWAPGGFPIMPRITEPFIILSSINVAQEAAIQNSFIKAMVEVVVEHAAAAGKAAGEALGAAAAGALEGIGPEIPKWVWPLVGVAGVAAIYAAFKS